MIGLSFGRDTGRDFEFFPPAPIVNGGGEITNNLTNQLYIGIGITGIK